MTTTVAQMSVDELRELIGEVLESKLEQMLGDPDAGLAVRPEVRDQLLRQMERVQRGDYGVPLSSPLSKSLFDSLMANT